MKRSIKVGALFIAAMLGACQTTSAAEPQAARLASTDTQTRNALKSVIATSLGRNQVSFGATDWASASTISVLPRAHKPISGGLNSHNFALPMLFDVMMAGPECYLFHRGSETKIPLQNIRCIAV